MDSDQDMPAMNKAQLRWRSRRRGMLELDLILGNFFDDAWHELSADEQRDYVRLLEETDSDLWQWLSRNARPDDASLAALVDRILDRVQP